MNELKPCPFCGGEVTAIETHPGRGELYCGKCDLVMCGDNAKTPEELTQAWNTRAERTCTPVDYIGEYYSHIVGESDEYYGAFCVCSECEKYVPMINYCPECGAKFERRDV